MKQRDRFFILYRFAWSFASAIDFLCAFALWWLCSSKRNSFLNLCRFVGLPVWSFNLHQKQRDRFFIL